MFGCSISSHDPLIGDRLDGVFLVSRRYHESNNVVFRDRSRKWLDRPEWPEPRRNPDFTLRLVTDKPIEPGENEQRNNPRSRSAKLRVAEKI